MAIENLLETKFPKKNVLGKRPLACRVDWLKTKLQVLGKNMLKSLILKNV